MNESVILTKDCEALQIPSGAPILLPKGAKVTITQALGGSYTIMTENGYMLRVPPEQADAIGKSIPEIPKVDSAKKETSLEELVWNQLRTCYDPEIPVNIVELGLVYECKITPSPEPDGGNKVEIKMTLTAPGCGMGESIRKEAEAKIARLPGIKQVNAELVWEPPWDQNRMSEAAKLQLGIM